MLNVYVWAILIVMSLSLSIISVLLCRRGKIRTGKGIAVVNLCITAIIVFAF